MRHHLDAAIDDDSVRRIYREYWPGADAATMDTMARAAMTEERGTPDCAYFDWYLALPWPRVDQPPESEPERGAH